MTKNVDLYTHQPDKVIHRLGEQTDVDRTRENSRMRYAVLGGVDCLCGAPGTKKPPSQPADIPDIPNVPGIGNTRNIEQTDGPS